MDELLYVFTFILLLLVFAFSLYYLRNRRTRSATNKGSNPEIPHPESRFVNQLPNLPNNVEFHSSEETNQLQQLESAKLEFSTIQELKRLGENQLLSSDSQTSLLITGLIYSQQHDSIIYADCNHGKLVKYNRYLETIETVPFSSLIM